MLILILLLDIRLKNRIAALSTMNNTIIISKGLSFPVTKLSTTPNTTIITKMNLPTFFITSSVIGCLLNKILWGDIILDSLIRANLYKSFAFKTLGFLAIPLISPKNY